MTHSTRWIAAGLLFVIPTVAAGQESRSTTKKPARPAIYDQTADAQEQVKSATTLARRDARRVLIMFGYNGCGWCHKLHGLFASNQEIRELLGEEYVQVMVDIESPHADEWLEKAKAALAPDELKKGVGFPFLAVLEGDGKIITAQQTDSLEVGPEHDPVKVKAFLEKWTAPKVSARQALDEAQARALSENKLVFLHFGSPTCGWCHKLDAFLAREDIALILGREFVDRKIDLERMTGADKVLQQYNAEPSGGIPWFVFTDAQGRAIATSDGPKGNIGYPATPEEIAHFIGMLRKAAPKLTPTQIDEIQSILNTDGKKPDLTRMKPVDK